jgi:hypothetical protein
MSSWKLAIPVLIAVTGFFALPDERVQTGKAHESSGAEM